MIVKKFITRLRKFRVWHRFLGTSLALFLFVSAVTGILLSLKKDVTFIQPATQKVEVDHSIAWLPIKELSNIAVHSLQQKIPNQESNLIDRIDFRPSKGIAKVIFEKGNWEIQLNGFNGEVLSVAKRHSDWIESLHDGSIISDLFKLVSMNVLGLGLIFMIATGLWLWYGPKKYRKIRKRKKQT